MNHYLKILGICLFLALSAGLIRQYLFTEATGEQGFFVQEEQSHREYYFELFDVETVRHPTIDSEYPTWAVPDETQSITSLQHWVDTLPYDQDRSRYGYVVYPKHGITVPFSTPNDRDVQKIRNGEMFNHYPYLEEGALHYWGQDPSQGFGNMVIAAHSSYIFDENGRYRTVFQALPISKKGDSIFVYLKTETGLYDLYTYIITDSFRTELTDISVLAQTRDQKTLTTYGCYIIGDNSERWINQAVLDSTQTNIPLAQGVRKEEKQINGIDKITLEAEKEKEVIDTHQVAEIQVTETEIQHSGYNTLLDIKKDIPESMIPQLEQLVMIIGQRLESEPHLRERVTTRLQSKISFLEGNETTEKKSVLAIYKFIAYYIY